MDPVEQGYTWQAVIDGTCVVGFADRGPGALDPDTTYDQDTAEFKSRMEGLLRAGAFAVVDFSNYRMTGSDNGRAVVGSLLAAHRGLLARGGGLLVCHHPVQLNPDLQSSFRLVSVIGIHRSRRDAIDAARSAAPRG